MVKEGEEEINNLQNNTKCQTIWGINKKEGIFLEIASAFRTVSMTKEKTKLGRRPDGGTKKKSKREERETTLIYADK